MPNAYTTQASIQAEIPPQWLNEALDDQGSGTPLASLLPQIIADASNEVDAWLSGIYQTPFPAYPGCPTKCSEWALKFSLEKIFNRRLMGSGLDNPYSSQCRMIRQTLKAMADRAPGAPTLDAQTLGATYPLYAELTPVAMDASLI